MPDRTPSVSFPIPDGNTVEVYIVELADGRVVARTKEELEALPAGARVLGDLARVPTGGGSR